MINFIIPIILLIIVLFIGFNFYRDIKHWMNTGSFVEGLTSQNSSPDMEEKEYKDFKYILNTKLKTWTEHEEIANKKGGHLVCIHSKEENDIVKSLIPKYQKGKMPNYIFIGARRIKQCEGCLESGKDGRYWSWVDGSKWDYTNWANGEPNDCCKDDTEGVGEPLGMMYESGLWNDIFHKHQTWEKGKDWNPDGTLMFPAVYKIPINPKKKVNLDKKTFDGGWTWQMAKESCEQDGNKLATKKEVIDYIGTPVIGDNWVPVSNNPNDWVQIGDRKSQRDKAPRQDFGLLHQEIPDVGYFAEDIIPDGKWNYAGGRPKWGDKKGTKKGEYYCKIDIDNQVRKAYREILGREPDPGGFNHWKSQLQNGMTVAELRTAFENSEEAKSKKQKQNKDVNSKVVLVGKEPVKPRRGNVLEKARDFNGNWDNYSIRLTIKPLSKQSGWRNIIHHSINGKDCCNNYERWPGIWFHSNTTRLHIRFQNNEGFDPDYELPLDKKSTIICIVNEAKVRTLIKDENDNIKFDETITLSEHSPPKNFTNEQKFYIGDIWYEPADVEITDLILNSNIEMVSFEKQTPPAPIESEIKCAAHYGSVEPSDGSNSGTVGNEYICPQSKPICKDYIFNKRWGYCTYESNTEQQKLSIFDPAPIENKAILQQPTIQNAQDTVIPTDNSLFNEDIVKKVLENKNVVSNDNVIIGKRFMEGVSEVRNIDLPLIKKNDLESLGEIVAKINKGQNDHYNKILLINSVDSILNPTQLNHSNVYWNAPGQAITARTTGMLGDNSNKIINNNIQLNNQQLNNQQLNNNIGPLPWNATESGNM